MGRVVAVIFCYFESFSAGSAVLEFPLSVETENLISKFTWNKIEFEEGAKPQYYIQTR